MRHIYEELKSTKASHKKIKVRLKALRLFVFWHYILLSLSGVQAALTLFVALNVPGVPFREVLFGFACTSLGVSCYLLYSGLSK